MSSFGTACLRSLFALTAKRLSLGGSAKLMLFGLATLVSTPVYAISNFTHIVIIFQENRTPDNLFWHLCDSHTCDPTGQNTNAYNVKTGGWLTQAQSGQTITINPQPVLLSNCDNDDGTGVCWDASHSHPSWVAMCDNRSGNGCAMDGAANEGCGDNNNGMKCQALKNIGQFPFFYVDDLNTIQPYLNLATEYGWANDMFQTNEGPSFPAHQFIFGATSAPNASQDAAGYFASENMSCGTTLDGQSKCHAGCVAPSGTTVSIVDPLGDENTSEYPCFERNTLSDLIESSGNLSWRYYANKEGGIWDAPNAINHICGGALLTHCTTNPHWVNVVLNPSQVLTDAAAPTCNLHSMSWVIPDGPNSDHPTSGSGGPAWVASIVDTIGQSKCTDSNGLSYWQDTAIVITWDDWGGWYDHVPPQILQYPQGGYQYGFRVPLIFVSAYGVNNNGGSSCQPIINNDQLDFGSVARFTENNFFGRAAEGELGFADQRSANDLSDFYNLAQSPCAFQAIPTRRDAHWFLTHKVPPTPPDTD